MQVLIDKAVLLDAIDYANDHPSMEDFYHLRDQLTKVDKVIGVTAKQAGLLKEALNELLNWLDTDEEFEEVEALLEALNAHVPS